VTAGPRPAGTVAAVADALPDAPPSSAPALLDACRGRPAPRVPVWFMRQAGRSLPEYRALRSRYAFADIVRRPEVAAEVTLQPVWRLGVDAAILFSDIVTPLQAVVSGIRISPDRGPVVDEPFRSATDLDRLRPLEPSTDVPYVADTIRLVRRDLPASVALIGFAGAPFTLASYLVEGGKSNDYRRTKALMYGEPALWARLVGRLADITLAALDAQVTAGAQAVQLFDSWAGALSEADYRRHVLPASRRVLDGLAASGVPRIHFAVGAGHLLEALGDAGADVVGVDWRTPLDVARRRLGTLAVQGNLDPTALFAPPDVLDAKVREVLAANGGRPGHVFNLGWGVLPDTDPGALRRVVELVHAEGTAGAPPAGGSRPGLVEEPR
jgi:uroporphyrinogen decarboxylase